MMHSDIELCFGRHWFAWKVVNDEWFAQESSPFFTLQNFEKI